jgi:hypothetical protein
MAILDGDFDKRPKEKAPDAIGTVGRMNGDAQLRRLCVHEAIRVVLGRPESKPRRANLGSLRFGDNTPVSGAAPVCQRLQEFGMFSELGQRWPRRSGVPEECREQHFLLERTIPGVKRPDDNHSPLPLIWYAVSYWGSSASTEKTCISTVRRFITLQDGRNLLNLHVMAHLAV